jgi:RNA polymerase sigma-70 factor (ECF subfamily)
MASSRFAGALFFKTEAQSQEERGTPMSDQQATIGNFHADLKMILPRLRIYALSLTRDSDRADDLMQRTVVKALTGRKSFQPGTNFPGWLFRIQRNEFISGLRSRRPTVTLDDTITNGLSHEPRQESGIIMREFKKAFYALSSCQRETLLLAALEGYSYERIAAHSGVSVGTVKSRVSRARATLKQILADEDSNASRRTPSDTRIFARHLPQHAGDHAAAAD